jgi:hypothetical protein
MLENAREECGKMSRALRGSETVLSTVSTAMIFVRLALAEVLAPGCGLAGSLGLRLWTICFAQAGGFALESAEVEQLGAAHLIGAQDLDFIKDLGIEGEDTLHTLAKADFADGEAALGTIAAGNNSPFKRLNAFFVAFFNPDLNADGISGRYIGNIFALQLGS